MLGEIFARWWTAHTAAHGEPSTWAEFKKFFFDQYIPIEIKMSLREEFLTLRQGDRTVSQYMEIFTYLLTFAMDVAGTERL
ncbi:hypothetical protein Scep_009349 [Stephania cephalantha]|uniref:Retrotransposon gag domain-containing protein n=1 Tax=Stephania cephalantha TaxID=152367 RepID=A0AAP0JUE8_9MAGN